MKTRIYSDTCVLFDTISLEGYSRMNFDRICEALDDICEVRAVTHVEKRDPTNDQRIIQLTSDDIFDGLDQHKSTSKKLIPGNCDLKFMCAALEADDFEHILWWEYDVWCTADIRQATTSLLEATRGHDFGASYISPRHPDTWVWCDPDCWVWWESLELPSQIKVTPESIATRAFLPLFSASRTLINVYLECLKAGWKGHSEVTIPTAVRYHGLTEIDISLTPTKFTNYPQFGLGVSQLEILTPPFIHPVKTYEQLQSLGLA